MITQQKTKKPVHFEITEQTREAVINLINKNNLTYYDFLFQSRFKNSKHLSTRQYALIVKKWVAYIGLDSMEFETHTVRRTKVALIYQKKKT